MLNSGDVIIKNVWNAILTILFLNHKLKPNYKDTLFHSL